MKHLLNTLTILLLGLLLGACSDQIQDEDLNLTPGLKGVKSQEVLYKAKDFIVLCNETSSTIENEILNIKGTIKRKQAVTGMYLVHSNEKDFLGKAKKIKGINAVIPDIQLQCIKPDEDFSDNAIALSIGSNEEYFGYLWGLDAINAPQAWDKGFTGNGVSIYILDSGIDAEHPDIAPILNTELSKSFVENEDFNIEPGFYFNHGTHVAGIIAASDGPNLGGYDFGVIGVAPKASIVAVKVLSEYTGSGAFSGIYSGVVYAANNGADVINMSLGSDVPRNGFLVELEDGSIVKVGADDVAHYINYAQKAITYAFQKGSLVVVAASNDYTDANHSGNQVFIPASLNHVLTVSATAPNGIATNPTGSLDYPASYTNYGQSLIDIAAPGGDFDFEGNYWYYDMVFSTISGGWGFSAGTSMAAPHVSGTAALVIEKLGGEATPTEVMTILKKSADDLGMPGKDEYYGHGRVNAAKAVDYK